MLNIHPIPILDDNYVWVAHNPATQCALVVDPGDAEPVVRGLMQRGLTLAAIFITHHHHDHIDGVAELRGAENIPVYGQPHPRHAVVTHPVAEGDRIGLEGLGTWEVLAIPGHTAEHLAFRQGDHVFVGDTVFSAGCGRIFDGTLEQLYRSVERINALPSRTTLYCTHEYTLANLAFAQVVDPENQVLAQRHAHASLLRQTGQPTVPMQLGDEQQYNPFLRTSHPSIVAAVGQHTGIAQPPGFATFAALRRWKDQFRPTP
jgi:hydroxyacylglutathione hydrolase